jgi:hypothetical protein
MDLNATHSQAANTAGPVQILVDRVRTIAGATARRPRAGFADLAAAGDELAAQAQTATDTIDQCLAPASRDAHADRCETFAIVAYDLAVKSIVPLGKIVDGAVAIYRRACRELANRYRVLEEGPVELQPRRIVSWPYLQTS